MHETSNRPCSKICTKQPLYFVYTFRLFCTNWSLWTLSAVIMYKLKFVYTFSCYYVQTEVCLHYQIFMYKQELVYTIRISCTNWSFCTLSGVHAHFQLFSCTNWSLCTQSGYHVQTGVCVNFQLFMYKRLSHVVFTLTSLFKDDLH